MHPPVVAVIVATAMTFVVLVFLVVSGFVLPAHADEIDWIAIGGGADPMSSQVSLEQDVRLAREVFGARGRVLFAGGREAFGVQVLREKPAGDALRVELGDLLDPRDGRRAEYRKPEIEVAGSATPAKVEAVLDEALDGGEDPLHVYIATHGEKGDVPADNAAILWGDFTMSASRLAELLEEGETKRTVRVVVTSCYAGGFAELAFAGADAANGLAARRCGLFASPADDVSSGCDPNPDRRAQDAYGLHFLEALRGRDRVGEALPRGDIDIDGDGTISLLEAHTRVRIAGRSFDVPTTTSERWLREKAAGLDATTAAKVAAIPEVAEEYAVMAALRRELDVVDEDAARARLAGAQSEFEAADKRLQEVGDEVADSAADLRILLLERWPALDDPWHPDFAATYAAHRDEIAALLHTGDAVKRYARQRREHENAGVAFDDAKVRLARVRVLVRAYETVDLAARLRAKGGDDWTGFTTLRRCERGSVPGDGSGRFP